MGIAAVGFIGYAVSGFIAATGLAVLFLAVALPAHYPDHFHTLGHLGLIYLATLIFVTGALLALWGSSPSIEAELRRRARPPSGGPPSVQDLAIKEENRTMQAQATLLCAKWGEATDGWKCAICGIDSFLVALVLQARGWATHPRPLPRAAGVRVVPVSPSAS